MTVPRLLNGTRHLGAALQLCRYSTLGGSSRPLGKDDPGPVFQYVGKHKKPNHKVFVWGFSFTGALGIPSFVVPDSGRKKPRKYQLTPYRLDTAEQISSAACGYGFTLIASRTKDVIKLWGMGLNKDSQLGFQRTQQSRLDSYEYVLEPSPVALPLAEPQQTRVLQVSCGRAHSLVLTDNEGVFSMGNNAYGQCGRRVVEDEVYSGSHVIHRIEGFRSPVVQVACGQDHSLFLTQTGQVLACGWGADGQTGLGHHSVSCRPVQVGGDLAGVEIRHISSYGDCSLAVSADGELFGWGNSEYLQLASVTEATQINSPRHLPVEGCGKVVQAACVGILAAYLGTAACIFVVSRLSPCEWSQPQTEQNTFSFLHSLWYTAGALTLQGAGPHPKALSGRIICCTWWFFTIVLLACYFSNLSSAKTPESTQLTVKGFDDLANQDVIEYGCLAGSSTLAFFKNSNNPVYRRIYEHMERTKSFVSSMDEGVRRAKEGSYAFIGESVSLDLAVARHCELVRAHEVVGMRGYSIAAAIGSPFIKSLNLAILQLSEAGELAYLRSKWWASSCLAERAKSSAVQAHSLKGMFLVLAIGLGLGALVAVLELITKSRRGAAEQKKPCCTVLSEELSLRLKSNAGTTHNDSDKEKA